MASLHVNVVVNYIVSNSSLSREFNELALMIDRPSDRGKLMTVIPAASIPAMGGIHFPRERC